MIRFDLTVSVLTMALILATGCNGGSTVAENPAEPAAAPAAASPATAAAPAAAAPAASSAAGAKTSEPAAQPAAAPRFALVIHEGRLWIYGAGSKDAAAFAKDGKPSDKHATKLIMGPTGPLTLKGESMELINEFVEKTSDFKLFVHDRALFAYAKDSKSLESLAKTGKPSDKHATKFGRAVTGPLIVKGDDVPTIDKFLAIVGAGL